VRTGGGVTTIGLYDAVLQKTISPRWSGGCAGATWWRKLAVEIEVETLAPTDPRALQAEPHGVARQHGPAA
jgi:hypothetical protein